MRPLNTIAWTLALLGTLPGLASAQVLKELEPVHLEYVIYWGDPLERVGEAAISFEPTDTRRGRRLVVKSSVQYVLPMTTPFDYVESCEMRCDERGAEWYRTEARAQGQERVNVAVVMGDDYSITSTMGGKTRTFTGTAGVRRTNLGLFAGAFLRDGLDGDGMLIDYPLLYPVGATHKAGQKYREGVYPYRLSDGKRVSAIKTRLKHKDETSDQLWNSRSGHQILLRLDQQSPQGVLRYELLSVNGVPAAESELIQ